MKTIHNIEGILDSVDIIRIPNSDEPIVSRVSIKIEHCITTVPYFGPIDEELVERMRGYPVKFIEQEKGFVFKEVDQTLAGENYEGSVSGLLRSDANAILRKFYN